MEPEEFYEIAAAPDVFRSSLINIRLNLDGIDATVDLIESHDTGETGEIPEDEDPVLKEILSQSTLITSSGRFARLHFYCVQAIVIQDEFRDIVDIVKCDLNLFPRLTTGETYPFMKVVNSRWKKILPDYQGGDNPDIQHFKIVSMATCIDVLARFEKIETDLQESEREVTASKTLNFTRR